MAEICPSLNWSANNNLEAELTIALEEAETRLESEKPELLCVHLQMTQLTIVTVHHMTEMIPDTETAKNTHERQFVGLYESPDVEL